MPITSTQINRHFACILRRSPQPHESRIWTKSERGPDELAEALLNQATEIRSIARLYVVLFGRFPDGLEPPLTGDNGLDFWVAKLRALRARHPGLGYKSALEYTIEEWFSAAEHLSMYGGDADADIFLDRLCEAAFGRSAKQAELEEWRARFDEARDGKAALAVRLAEAEECKRRFNAEIDGQLMKLAASDSEAA